MKRRHAILFDPLSAGTHSKQELDNPSRGVLLSVA